MLNVFRGNVGKLDVPDIWDDVLVYSLLQAVMQDVKTVEI